MANRAVNVSLGHGMWKVDSPFLLPPLPPLINKRQISTKELHVFQPQAEMGLQPAFSCTLSEVNNQDVEPTLINKYYLNQKALF